MGASRWMMALVGAVLALAVQPAIAQETDSYGYDPLGRLVTVSRSGGANSGQSVSTVYDPAGNRTSYASAGVVAAISIAPATANEGSVLTFVVTRSGGTGVSASASWATTNGTATSGVNYTASSGTVSFAVGVSSTTVTVPTIVDHVYTANLAMAVTLSTPSSGWVLGTSSAAGTIVNTDPVPTANLSIAAASANEGLPLSFVVTRSGNTSSAVTVNYTTANGTAIAGANYSATSGTLNFAANSTSQAITVATIDDHVVSSNLTMSTALSSPSSGASITTGTAAGTIANIDTGWSAALTSGTYTVCVMGSCIYYYGYTTTTGSLTPSTFNGYTITSIYNVSSAAEYVTMTGATAPPNSGWTSITIPGVGTLPRSAATYSASGTGASWSWAGAAHVTSGTVTIQ